MGTNALNAVVAIAGGLVIAIASFVPAAAVHYRRAGRFTLADLAALIAVPVYGLALWAYTLLPLPDPDAIVCKTALVEPFHFVEDLRAAWAGSVMGLVRDPVFLQIALNVALFVPMGVLLRWRYHRGLVWALGLGLSTSLLIETTQLTGIWGLYDCAYRFFDVDDLIFNTAGAVLGSLIALPLARHHRHSGGPTTAAGAAPAAPTFGRRVVAMVSDALTMLFTGAVAVVAWRIWLIELRDTSPREVDTTLQAAIQWGTAFVIQAVVVLSSGRTIGEAVVRVRTVARSRARIAVGRVVKLGAGVGAVAALAAWDSPWASAGLAAFAVVSLIAAAMTRGHRGFSNLVAGLDVEALPPLATAGAHHPPRR